MDRKRKILKTMALSFTALLALFSIVVTLSIAPVASLIIPAQNEKQFENAITEKMDRLRKLSRAGENKVIIIGGSSTAFGFESALIEKYTGMPVVNLGTYAILGSKLMLDLADRYIDDGDIVIISPEIDSQTLSMYFASSPTLRAIDGSFSLLFDIPLKHWINLYGASWNFAVEKWGYYTNGNAPDPSGIYNADNFNEYGDIDLDGANVPRVKNEMAKYYDETNNRIILDEQILDDGFADYLNSYYKKITRKGAEAYFYYCPMNVLSVDSTGTYENRYKFEEHLKKKLDIPILGTIDDHIMEAGYFFDTNFHLNVSGARMNTILLLEELFLEQGNAVAIEEINPPAPKLPIQNPEFEAEDPNSEYFTFEQGADGFYKITGVKEEYKDLVELTIPLGYNGYKVNSIGRAAFRGSNVDKLIITKDTNLTDIENGAFIGAKNLSGLYIYCRNAGQLPPPENFNGTQSDFKIYFEPGSSFQDGYYWKPLFDAGLKWAFIE